jgi:hypothetical protein
MIQTSVYQTLDAKARASGRVQTPAGEQQTFSPAGSGFSHPKLGGFAMARTPNPWFWKQCKAWYVTIDGTRYHLAADKEAAVAGFHQLMAQPQVNERAPATWNACWRPKKVPPSQSIVLLSEPQRRSIHCDLSSSKLSDS